MKKACHGTKLKKSYWKGAAFELLKKSLYPTA
jgi:hypothetical protein